MGATSKSTICLMKEEDLIFIVSQPRAGSTYLQNLISNNPITNTCSEPWILLNFANMVKPALVQASFNNKLATRAFQEYINKYPVLDYQKKRKQFLLDLYKPMADGFTFVIDKTPRYWELLDEIVALFPKSKIIILKRNPIDVAKSMANTWSLDTMVKLSVFSRDILIAPKILQAFSEKHEHNSNIFILKYEDLVNDTGREISNLYQWIGIDYSESVLDVSENTKYKGIYGDPYQNSDKEYKETKENQKIISTSKEFQQFLKGYAHYLGIEFLAKYGGYQLESTNSSLTKTFKYFIHLNSRQKPASNFKKRFKCLVNEVYFELFK